MKNQLRAVALVSAILIAFVQHPASAQVSAPGKAITAVKLPRGLRNNNPLNIEAGRFTEAQPGYIGSDGRFATFETMDAGVAAADRLLKLYGAKYGINTIDGVIRRWAPPVENDTKGYAKIVATKLRIKPHDTIDLGDPEFRMRLVYAMAEVENGMPIRR